MKYALLLLVWFYVGDVFADTTDVGTVLSRSVVVSSARATDETPITQATIDSLHIASTMVGQDAEFVLERTSPSIVAYSESGTGLSNYGSFRLRGIDQTRVNITLNGAPLNDMIDQGVFFSNITDLLNGARSVQVQRGVGVSGNGTASFAGSVSIETPMPISARPAARLQLTTGSYGLLRGSAEVSSGTIIPGLAASVKLSTFSTDGYRYHTATSGNSGMVGLSYLNGKNLFRITAVGGRTKNQLGYLPVPKALADLDPRTNIDDSTDNDDFGQYLLQAEWTHALTMQTAFSFMAYAGGAGGDYFAGYRDSAGTLAQTNYPLQNNNYGVLGSLTLSDLAPGINVNFGVHAYTFARHNWESISPDLLTPYYSDSTVKQELSLFAKASWELTGKSDYPRTIVQLDVQNRYVILDFTPDQSVFTEHTAIPTHHWNFFNAKAGISHLFNESQKLYASFGRTGREPTRFDFLGGTQITPANVNSLTGPQAVKPEYVLDVEAGWEMKTKMFASDVPNLAFDINGFYMAFTNEIAPVGQYIEQYFVQLRTNVAASKRYGIEANLDYQVIPSVSVHGNLTLMKGTIQNVYIAAADTTVANVSSALTPSSISAIQAEWKPVNWLSLNLGARTVSASFLELTNNPDLMLQGFALYNAGLTAAYHQFTIRMQVNNLTDVRYATNGGVDYSAGIARPAVFMQAGRNVWLLFEASL